MSDFVVTGTLCLQAIDAANLAIAEIVWQGSPLLANLQVDEDNLTITADYRLEADS